MFKKYFIFIQIISFIFSSCWASSNQKLPRTKAQEYVDVMVDTVVHSVNGYETYRSSKARAIALYASAKLQFQQYEKLEEADAEAVWRDTERKLVAASGLLGVLGYIVLMPFSVLSDLGWTQPVPWTTTALVLAPLVVSLTLVGHSLFFLDKDTAYRRKFLNRALGWRKSIGKNGSQKLKKYFYRELAQRLRIDPSLKPEEIDRKVTQRLRVSDTCELFLEPKDELLAAEIESAHAEAKQMFKELRID